MSDLAADLDLIRNAAEAAGRLALAERDAGLKVWSKSGGSPVTSADMAVDQLLRDTLLGAPEAPPSPPLLLMVLLSALGFCLSCSSTALRRAEETLSK